jgi:hypothetical protein
MDFQYLTVERQKVKDECSVSLWLNRAQQHSRSNLKYHLLKALESYIKLNIGKVPLFYLTKDYTIKQVFLPWRNCPYPSPVGQGHLGGSGGLEDACWPLVPKFAGSNPAETVGFFRSKKSPARLSSKGK